MTADLQARMQHDLEVLKKAFPHLQEQFSSGKWMSEIYERYWFWIYFRNQCVFEPDLEARPYPVFILSVVFVDSRNQYRVDFSQDSDFSCSTIYEAIEFIGRVSRGLTPINASAAALEARLGGAS